ncbi:hypothetical protein DPSP01_003337 [Paraphaeosphaeria sporulosa]|uniref:DUF1772-domain-containing protein n=1 Tax=Paraphaeosphaeria sporulosa TaxID=1460663 RepID=A0A177CYN1_9PLEO|nr:uncharacterized protein CC84DRAFT_1211604 [Paraphaeosphaeria sporulosa]OAG11987.1 hypothetical protein CC84DRAFT_1211604 [Paraphaeosphaeria sporulosa]
MATAGYLFNERPPAGLLIAQAVGITASTYLLGGNATIAFVTIPAVMDAPSPLAAKQWARVYERAKPFGIGCSVIAAACTGFVAYNQDPASLPFKLNAAATLIIPAIMPFTVLVLKPINDKLFAKGDALALDEKAEVGVAQEETTKALIDRWTKLHLVRTAITGVGAILAIWAALDKRETGSVGGFSLQSGANRLG